MDCRQKSPVSVKVYATTEKIDFRAVLPHGVSGLSMLPEWMLAPLMNYSELKSHGKTG